MPPVAIVARVTVKEGKASEYLAAMGVLIEQAKEEPGNLVYAVSQSKDDPNVFWSVEFYADQAAFAVHASSEVTLAAAPVLTELIAVAEVTIGETLLATGLDG